MEEFRHAYATMDKDWIGAWVLPEGKPIKVRLKEVLEKDISVAGRKKHAAIAYFEPNPYFNKPFILSAKKNLDRLTEWFGTANIYKWKNFDVKLQQELDKNPNGGGKVWALRICPKAELKPDTETWTKTVAWLKDSKDNKIETVLANMKISDANLIKIKKEANV